MNQLIIEIARQDIKKEFKSVHTKDPYRDNYTVTTSYLFTKESNRLNRELGL